MAYSVPASLFLFFPECDCLFHPSFRRGANAKAAAYVELRVNDSETLYGVGMDSNITQAAFRAVMSAVARSGAVAGVKTPVAESAAA